MFQWLFLALISWHFRVLVCRFIFILGESFCLFPFSSFSWRFWEYSPPRFLTPALILGLSDQSQQCCLAVFLHLWSWVWQLVTSDLLNGRWEWFSSTQPLLPWERHHCSAVRLSTWLCSVSCGSGCVTWKQLNMLPPWLLQDAQVSRPTAAALLKALSSIFCLSLATFTVSFCYTSSITAKYLIQEGGYTSVCTYHTILTEGQQSTSHTIARTTLLKCRTAYVNPLLLTTRRTITWILRVYKICLCVPLNPLSPSHLPCSSHHRAFAYSVPREVHRKCHFFKNIS